MCGLTGYVNLYRNTISSKVIKQMLEVQRHRGPDDNGVVFINKDIDGLLESSLSFDEYNTDAAIVLGFNRLSIQDLSHNGHQPMLNESKDIVLMLNGEIYNAFDYKETLEERGYHFKSKSDTEVVLHLYQEYGIEQMAQMLNGMFAIVIFDLGLKKLFLLRDRFGIKPLYVIQNRDYFAFSSELKSFKYLPEFRFELDQSQLDEYLIFRNNINNTLFKGIKNIDQGSILSFDLITNDVSVSRYFDINKVDSITSNGISYDNLLESIKRAVGSQMISDVKLGTQLSGGIDSSLVTHYSKQLTKDRQLETVSIIFDNPKYSEESYIDLIAAKEKVKSNKYNLDKDFYINNLYDATWHFEHPINHPNTIGIYLLSKQAKNHVTVLLSGEGADELFGGYDTYSKLFGMSFLARGFLSKVKSNTNNLFTFLKYNSTKKGRMLTSYSFGQSDLAKKIYKSFKFKKAIKQRELILNSINGSAFTRQRKFDFMAYLPDLLMRQDKMSMAHSIENRVPYLDNNLVDLAFNVPEEWLIKRVNNQYIGKHVLKQISEELYGKEFTYRRKAGFGIPLKEFFQSSAFTNLWTDRILPGMKKRSIFEVVVVKKWYQSISKLSNKEIEMLWIAISFEIWAQQYLD